MSQDTYEQLAEALDRLPNGFPRTPSGVEIKLLKKIFSKDEAMVAGQLSRNFEPVLMIANRLSLPVKDVRKRLVSMTKRGLWGR
jgi:electron transport complex protein RnfB